MLNVGLGLGIGGKRQRQPKRQEKLASHNSPSSVILHAGNVKVKIVQHSVFYQSFGYFIPPNEPDEN